MLNHLLIIQDVCGFYEEVVGKKFILGNVFYALGIGLL